jgi:alpha-tubulin suppressor-like RCC1 family protein/cytoskeletal protein CcmA (bactofilin family)
MPTYDGIGETITHKLEIEGDMFLQDIEGGSLSTQVPLEIFSNFTSSGDQAISSRMLRLRVQNHNESNVSNSYVTDFGIRGESDKDYFFITAPQNTYNVGDQNTFVISKTSNVGIGTTDPGSYRLLVNKGITKHFGVPGNDTPTVGDTLVYNENGEWVYHFVDGTLPPGTVNNEILTWNGANWVPNHSMRTTNSNTSIGIGVGIGTFTPGANLHVVGSVTATKDIDISGKFQGGKLRIGSALSPVPTNPNVTVPGDLTVSGTLTSDEWIHTTDVTITGNVKCQTLTASDIVGGSPLTISADSIAIEGPVTMPENAPMSIGTMTVSNIFHTNQVTISANIYVNSDKTLTTSNITHDSELTVSSNLLLGSDKTLTTSNIVSNSGDNLLINTNLEVGSSYFLFGDGGLLSNISTGIPTLQEVTTEGSTTTDSITVGGLTTSNITHDSELTVSSNLLLGSDKTLTTSNIVSNSGDNLLINTNLEVGSSYFLLGDGGLLSNISTGIPTLQEVTTEGSTTTDSITVGGLTTSNITHDSELTVSSNLLLGSDKTLTTSNIVSNSGDNLLINTNLEVGSSYFLLGDGGLLSNISGGGGTTPTLQEVTTQGATTTDSITIGGLTTSSITSAFNTLTATTDVTMVQASGGGTLTLGVIDAAVYDAHSGFVDADGNLWMTGKNDYGQCGDLINSVNGNTFRKVATDVSKVYCGRLFTFFIKNDGSLWGMGFNLSRRMGPSNFILPLPTQLISGSPSKVVKVAPGYYSSLAIKEDGSIWGCGQSLYIGFGASYTYYNWTRLSISGSPASGIDINCVVDYGYNRLRSFIIDTNNDLYGCGDGGNYGFGNGSTADLNVYTSLTSGVVSVAGVGSATSAVLTDGTLINAGVFRYGSYGDGNVTKTVTTWTASTITGSSITSVSHAENHRIVRDANSNIYGAGWTNGGIMGTATASITTWTNLAPGVPIDNYQTGADNSYYINSSNDKLYLAGLNDNFGYIGFGTQSYAFTWTVNPATYTAYTGNSLTAVDIDVTGTLSTGSLTTSALITGGNFLGDTITSNISLSENATVTGTLSTNYISINPAVSSNLSISSNLEVGNSNLFVDTTTGRVGIGVTSPIRRLDVRSGTSGNVTTDWISGTFGPQLNDGDRVVIGNIFTKATIGGHNSSLTAWADLIINPGTGNVGIGITNPSYQLQLSTNSAAKPTSSAWTVSSDQRIKEDIFDANLDTCYENVKNLKLKYYKLRDDIIELDPIFKDAHKLGWIAQEVEEVLPKCVTTIQEQYGLNDVKNLDVDQIYTNLFGAVQKLIKENENLKARIEALENSS